LSTYSIPVNNCSHKKLISNPLLVTPEISLCRFILADVTSVHEKVHMINTERYYTEITDYENAKNSEYQVPHY
jgi:hypothetical protein